MMCVLRIRIYFLTSFTALFVFSACAGEEKKPQGKYSVKQNAEDSEISSSTRVSPKKSNERVPLPADEFQSVGKPVKSREKVTSPSLESLTPQPKSQPISTEPMYTISSPAEVPDLDFSVNFVLNGGVNPNIKIGVSDATKIMLARIRTEYPSVYAVIKNKFRKAKISNASGGYAVPYEIIDSCADEYVSGFTFQYTNYVHEFGHLLYWAISEGKPDISEEINHLYGKDGFVSDYAKQNVEEFFAESTAAWFNIEGNNWAAHINHNALKVTSPGLYNILEKLFLKPVKN